MTEIQSGGGMFSKLINPHTAKPITTQEAHEPANPAGNALVHHDTDTLSNNHVPTQNRTFHVPQPPQEEELRMTVPLPSSSNELLTQLERTIFSKRSVRLRAKQRLTKNSVLRAWIKVLKDIAVNLDNVEDENDLYRRFKEAVEKKK